MEDQAAEQAAHAAMQALARPFPAMGMLAVRQDGVKTSYANTPHGLHNLASWAIFEADKQAEKDEAEIATVISTLENTVQKLHVQVEKVAMSTDRHVIKMMEQQKKAHQAEMEVKQRAYQAEIQQLKQKLERPVSVPGPSAVAIPSPAFLPTRNLICTPVNVSLAVSSQDVAVKPATPMADQPQRTFLSLGLSVDDKKPFVLPMKGGQVQLVNPNALAFQRACGPEKASDEEHSDTANDAVHQEWLQSIMPESDLTVEEFQNNMAKALFDGYNLYYLQQRSSHKGSATEVDAILREKWHQLPAAERQQWAQGSAKRKRQQSDPHATESEDEDIFSAPPKKKTVVDDDCVCLGDLKASPAKSHRQNALEACMAANGGSANGGSANGGSANGKEPIN